MLGKSDAITVDPLSLGSGDTPTAIKPLKLTDGEVGGFVAARSKVSSFLASLSTEPGIWGTARIPSMLFLQAACFPERLASVFARSNPLVLADFADPISTNEPR